MLMPSIFGENLFNDDWMDFSFPDVLGTYIHTKGAYYEGEGERRTYL